MSGLWVQSGSEWCVMRLTGGIVALRDAAGAVATRADGTNRAIDPVVIIPRESGDSHLLLCAAESNVLVNGLPTFGIRILAHRDEVRVGRQQLYFSSERLVRSEPFTGPDGTCCALCRLPIERETLAARCICNLWFHQSEKSGCFLYADRCCGCEAPTAIDADFTWTPESF